MSNSWEFDSLARLAQTKAREAMHKGHPVEAREWLQAAAIAAAAANGDLVPILRDAPGTQAKLEALCQ